jgi:uncharacterized protein
MPPVDWSKALEHLPVQDILKNVDGPRGIFADAMPVPTGGRMIQRTPNDPAWYKGGLWHDDMKLEVPGLWQMSWYDVSVGPNIAMFNHVQKTAPKPIADQQWMIIAPVAHCAYTRDREHGGGRAQHGGCAARLSGDHVRLLRQVPEGGVEHARRHAAEGHLLHDGLEQVADLRHLAAEGRLADDVLPRTAAGKANTLNGDGMLTPAPPADSPDAFTYDPMNPVRSLGGNVCCTGNAIQAGAFDQRKTESGRTSSSTRPSPSRRG